MKVLEEATYEIRCPVCESLLEYTREDIFRSQGDGLDYLICPVCSNGFLAPKSSKSFPEDYIFVSAEIPDDKNPLKALISELIWEAQDSGAGWVTDDFYGIRIIVLSTGEGYRVIAASEYFEATL